MTMLRVYAEEGNSALVDTGELFLQKKNWFIGWKCLAGTRSLTIDQEGNLFSGDCRSLGSFGRQGSYGNIFTEFQLEKGPINCARRFCETEADLSIPKYHRPKFAEILTGQGPELEVTRPVAMQGESRKKVHWNISHFSMKELSHWKECVHKLEVFFKGEAGIIILRNPPVNSSEFFRFLDFISVDKGHAVTVEGNYLSAPQFFHTAFFHADLILRFNGDEASLTTHLRKLGEIYQEQKQKRIDRTATVQFDIQNPEYAKLRKSLEGSWVKTGFYSGISDLPAPAVTQTIKQESPRVSSGGTRILLFIPMRNCEQTISGVIAGLDQNILKHVTEILILDNDSGDKSMRMAQVASREIQGIKVVIRKNEKNYGFGGSHKLAFKYASLNKMDFILVVHGDNSGSVSEFLPILESGEFREYDIVSSSRLTVSGARSNYPLYRLVGNWILNLIASLVTFSRVSDFSGGPVQLFRVQTFLNKHENHLGKFSDLISFTQDAFLHVIHHRGRVRFLPITFREAGGKSHYSALTQFIQSLVKIVTYRFR